MHSNAARALYTQIEDGLKSMATQLRSAINAEARAPAETNGRSHGVKYPIGRRASDWGLPVGDEFGSVLLNTVGLPATIEWHLREFRKSTDIICALNAHIAEGFDLPAPYAEAIFETYREAISNVARHAVASHVWIELTVTSRDVTLVMRDNGIGIRDRDSRHGEGIARMRARADRYHGLCAIAGTPKGGGTTVTFSLPVARVL
jgi:signal transduction histidine kinase